MTFTTPAPKRPSFTGGARTNGRPTPTAAERREIEDDIRRDRIAQHGPEMIALIAEAKAFRKTWGSYTVDGWLFDAIYGIHLTQIDEDRIRAGMSATIAKAAERIAEARATPYVPVDGDNLMSDVQVAAGIRWLRVGGWNAYDKSLLHGCNGMLDIDYAGAIAVARGIIGKYSKTLYKAGVLWPAAATP